MAYQLIWEDNGVIAHFKGSINDLELREIVSKFYGNESFDSIKHLLINFLEVEKFDISDNALQQIGAMDSAAALTNPNVRVVMVVNNIAFLERLSSYEKISQDSPWPLCYFDSVKKAQEWIAT